jgi:hypothetical protein
MKHTIKRALLITLLLCFTLLLNACFDDDTSSTPGSSNTVNTSLQTGNNINVVYPGGSLAVPIVFSTNTGTATQLQITSGLSSLPTGWSSTSGSTFSCSTVNMGNGCTLSLSFEPTSPSNDGTLTLNYSYTDSVGTAKTGSVVITYNAVTNNNVNADLSITPPVTVAVNGSQNEVITFTSDDDETATNFSVISGLGGSLPAGWSGPSILVAQYRQVMAVNLP